MILGYARVSSDDQNLDLQIDALQKFGCERIFPEKITSAKEIRPELNKLLSHLRSGDTVVVWRLDRLGRSTKELISIIEGFQLSNVKFISLTESLDTTTASGKLIFQVFAAFAEFERNLIRERTKAGLAAARADWPCGRYWWYCSLLFLSRSFRPP